MKHVIGGFILFMVSISTIASAASGGLTFTKVKDDFVTHACYLAASQGIEVVEQYVEKRSLSFTSFKRDVSCNNQPIEKFAARMKESRNQAGDIQLTANNKNLESRVCIAALSNSLEDITKKFKVNPDYIVCNKVSLKRFLEKNEEANIADKDAS